MDYTTQNPEELEAILGEQLRAERLRKNLTMSEVAESAGISEGTLRNIEAGKGGRIETLIRLLRVFGRTQWLTTFRPPVKISPLQLAKGTKSRQRASGANTRSGDLASRVEPRAKKGMT